MDECFRMIAGTLLSAARVNDDARRMHAIPADFAERYVREGFWRARDDPRGGRKRSAGAPRFHRGRDTTRSLTFSQLVAEARSLAALLSRNGIERNDRVVIQLPNCVEFATLTLACLELGAIPVMALPAFRKAELEYLVSFADAKAIAIAPDLSRIRSRRSRPRTQGAVSFFQRRRPADASACMSMAAHRVASDPRRRSFRRSVVPALRRHHRDAEAHPAHSRRLSVQRARVRGRCGLTPESRILMALPAEHNFPLACPGLLGALLSRRARVLQPIDQGGRSCEHDRARTDHSSALRSHDRDRAVSIFPNLHAPDLASLQRDHRRRTTAPGAYARASQEELPASRCAASAWHGRGFALLHSSRRRAKKSHSQPRAARFRLPTKSRSSTSTELTSRLARLASCGAAGRTRFAVISRLRIAIAKRSPPTDSIALATWCGSIHRGI